LVATGPSRHLVGGREEEVSSSNGGAMWWDLDDWLGGLARIGPRGPNDSRPPWGLLLLGLLVLLGVLVVVLAID
jgi:hypothetical protein